MTLGALWDGLRAASDLSSLSFLGLLGWALAMLALNLAVKASFAPQQRALDILPLLFIALAGLIALGSGLLAWLPFQWPWLLAFLLAAPIPTAWALKGKTWPLGAALLLLWCLAALAAATAVLGLIFPLSGLMQTLALLASLGCLWMLISHLRWIAKGRPPPATEPEPAAQPEPAEEAFIAHLDSPEAQDGADKYTRE